MTGYTHTEAQASAVLRRIASSGRAAEFMDKVVFGGGMFTWDPDGSIVILDGDQTQSVLDQLGVES